MGRILTTIRIDGIFARPAALQVYATDRKFSKAQEGLGKFDRVVEQVDKYPPVLFCYCHLILSY
jgi:hypothetical protein